jgi:hypothetical protein
LCERAERRVSEDSVWNLRTVMRTSSPTTFNQMNSWWKSRVVSCVPLLYLWCGTELILHPVSLSFGT